MTILAKITFSAVDYYLSDRSIVYDGNFYFPYLLGFEPLQYSVDQPHGGFVRPKTGGFKISNAFFTAASFSPDRTAAIVAYYYEDATATEVFRGSCYLTNITSEFCSYEIFEQNITQNFLTDAPDFGAETDRLYPVAFGSFTMQRPLRVGTALEYKFYKSSATGTTPGVSYNVYDNAVNIDSNVVDNLDGTFSLSVSPVGEVRFSGTGTTSTLFGLVTIAAANLSLSTNTTNATDANLSVYIETQTDWIKLISDVCLFHNHLFYISGSTLFLVDIAKNNGTLTLNAYQFISASYHYNQPFSRIRYQWKSIEAGTDESGFPVYVNKDNEVIYKTGISLGADVILQAQNIPIASATSNLFKTATYWLRSSVSLVVPLDSTTYAHGQAITFTDTKLPKDTTITFRIRNIQFDFEQRTITLSGDGSFFGTISSLTLDQVSQQRSITYLG